MTTEDNSNNGSPKNDAPKVQQQNLVVPTINYAKPFPDVSKIEVFAGQNFRRWQERISSTLDLHGVASALTNSKPPSSSTQKEVDTWEHANKVCRHTIMTTLSNELFDVYCSYKEAKEIWDSMVLKYTAENAGKKNFVIGNYYRWTMLEEKDIKDQINEYHKLIEELKAENIPLPDEFIAGILIEKLPESWNNYKNQLKHKQKQLPLADLITHIIIEDTNRKESRAAKARALASQANLIQNNTNQKRRYDNKPNRKSGHNKNNHVPRVTNPTFKNGNGGHCYVCGKIGHYAPQCRHRKKNENPPEANLAEGDDDIIAAVIAEANIVTDVNKWVVDSGATRHICATKDAFTSYNTVGDGEELVYLGDSRTAAVSGKGKVMLKLTSGKTLALSDVLHVPNIRTNLISVALLSKGGIKVSFESDKIVMTKDNVFVGKGYCDKGLFVLNIAEVMHN